MRSFNTANMFLGIVSLLAFASALNVTTTPQNPTGTSYENQTAAYSGPPGEGVYDCHGSTMCRTLKVQACDIAVNSKLIRNDDINYGAQGSSAPHVGVCHGLASDFGCAILIIGHRYCTRSGNQMWWDYQEIRERGCHHCGHKYFADGCSTTIDYYPQCDLIH